MKYYSEITKKVYDTPEELSGDEAKTLELREKIEAEKKEIFDAIEAADKADEKVCNLLTAFELKYGIAEMHEFERYIDHLCVEMHPRMDEDGDDGDFGCGEDSCGIFYDDFDDEGEDEEMNLLNEEDCDDKKRAKDNGSMIVEKLLDLICDTINSGKSGVELNGDVNINIELDTD